MITITITVEDVSISSLQGIIDSLKGVGVTVVTDNTTRNGIVEIPHVVTTSSEKKAHTNTAYIYSLWYYDKFQMRDIELVINKSAHEVAKALGLKATSIYTIFHLRNSNTITNHKVRGSSLTYKIQRKRI